MLLSSNDHLIVFQVVRHIEIHCDIGKGSLETDSGRDVNIKDKFLNRLLHVSVLKLVMPYKWGQQGIKIGDGLGTRSFSLQCVKEVDYLAKGRSKVFGRRTLYLAFHTLKAIFKKVF